MRRRVRHASPGTACVAGYGDASPAQWVAYPDEVALGPAGYAARWGTPLADVPAGNTPSPLFEGVDVPAVLRAPNQRLYEANLAVIYRDMKALARAKDVAF